MTKKRPHIYMWPAPEGRKQGAIERKHDLPNEYIKSLPKHPKRVEHEMHYTGWNDIVFSRVPDSTCIPKAVSCARMTNNRRSNILLLHLSGIIYCRCLVSYQSLHCSLISTSSHSYLAPTNEQTRNNRLSNDEVGVIHNDALTVRTISK